jgi:hypothetical protein
MFFKFKMLKKLPNMEEAKAVFYLSNTRATSFSKLFLSLRAFSMPPNQFAIYSDYDYFLENKI